MSTELVVEKGSDGLLWGRVNCNDNLITETAGTLEELQERLKTLCKDFEDVEIDSFDISYDLTVFFQEHKYLNISEVAKVAGINPGLLRQYTSGVKNPRAEQVAKLEAAVHKLGEELKTVSLISA